MVGRGHNLANSWQQPNDAEPGGATWHKIEDPGTGWLASKTSGWTADRLSTATGGMAVDFSPVVPAGTKAVLVWVQTLTASGPAYCRRHGDTEISNTPNGSSEYSHAILGDDSLEMLSEVWLSTDYKIEIAVTDTNQDIYVSYPRDYML